MTEKDYELRDLNEKFYKEFYIPKMTKSKIKAFIKRGGNINYDRDGTDKNLIWKFLENPEYMKKLDILQYLIDNGLNINDRQKSIFFDSDWRGKQKTLLIHVLKMFSLNYYSTFNTTFYNKKIVNNFVKKLLDNGATLPIFEENGQKYVDFDSENKYDIYKTQVEKGFVLPDDVKLYRNKKDDAFNWQLDDLSSAFDENTEVDNKLDIKEYKISEYTFEDWALEYLDGYEKDMETYDGDIECVPHVIWSDYDDRDGYSEKRSKRITSLKGCPKIINGNFNCSENELKTLEYGPEIVKGNFTCRRNCMELLKGSPIEVKGYFDCSKNWLKTLEGSPRIIGETFYCNDNSLISLKGSPSMIGGYFNCNNNENLKTLEHISKDIKNDIYCVNCKSLKDIYAFVNVDKNFVYHANTKVEQNNITFERWALRYLPGYEKGMEVYEGHINCSNYRKENCIEISSLKGCPSIVKGNFDCSYNKLTSLEGGPEVVEGVFDCSYNKLKSLKGAPKKLLIGYKNEFDPKYKVNKFICFKNKLQTLEYIPKLDDELGEIDASYNHLKNIEHIQNNVLKDLAIRENKIKSLKGCPEILHYDFHCDKNELESLEFGPKKVGNYYTCDDNKLKSLKYMPEEVPYIFECRNNLLENLEHHPIKIGTWSDCSNNRLKTLKGIENSEIRMYLNIYGNPEIKEIDFKPKKGNIVREKRGY